MVRGRPEPATGRPGASAAFGRGLGGERGPMGEGSAHGGGSVGSMRAARGRSGSTVEEEGGEAADGDGIHRGGGVGDDPAAARGKIERATL